MSRQEADTGRTRTAGRIRRLGIAYALISLIAGFTVGLFRLFKDNGTFYLNALSPWYHLHSVFLIFGFLGGLLMTERIAGSAGIRGVGAGTFNASMLLLSIAGVLMLPVGWVYRSALLRMLGALFLAVGALQFTLLLIRLGRVARDYSSFGIMASGTVSLALSAVSSAFRLPDNNFPMILQMLLFPVLFILGERIELTRFSSFAHRKALTTSVHSLAWFAVSITALSSAMYMKGLDSYVFALSLAVMLLLIITALTFAMERKRKMQGAATRLQTYLDTGINIAYCWIFFGILLFLMRINGITGLYDASIHAIALGFIATFIVAHGPVIFPVVLGRKADISRLSFLPLYMVTLSNIMRVFGDIAGILSLNSGTALLISSSVVSLSGIMLAIAAVAFAVMMRMMMSATRAGDAKGKASRKTEG